MTINSLGVVTNVQDYYAGVYPAKSGSEVLRSYNNSTPNEKYKFTGKERDTETDLDYFGARYYDSELGRWLSVDPKAWKYPSLSPYTYTADNPIRYIDPNGKELKPSGALVETHNRMYKESATYRNMVDRVNKRLGKIDVPMREASLKEIRGNDKNSKAVGVTNPGITDNKYTVEGTKILVGEKTELRGVSSKTQEGIIAHEVEHLDQLTADPAALQQSVSEYADEPHGSRPHEIQANEIENTVYREIEKSRIEEQEKQKEQGERKQQ